MDLEKFWDQVRQGEPGANEVLSDYLQETILAPFFQRFPKAVQVTSPERRRHGTVFRPSPVAGHYVYVEPKKRVVLFGLHAKWDAGGKRTFSTYEKIFQLGDEAEYGSYNLHYTGTITAIGKRIVITAYKGSPGMERNHSLDLHQFDWRNYDFDAEKIRSKNADTMMYI